MKTFELNKLVKDKRYDDMIASGWNVKEDVLANNKKALIDALHAKRKEEIDEADKIAQEVPLDKKKLLDELADAQQVVNDIETTLPTEVRLDVYKKRIKNICAQHAIELQEILDLQVEKEAKEGGFTGGHYVKWLQMREDDERYKYFEKKYKKINTL